MRCALTRVIFAIFGLALLALIAMWNYRVPLTAWAVSSVLEQKGFGPVRITVDKVGLREFVVRGVSLRGGAIQARQVAANYDLIELSGAHLHRVTLTGLKISLSAGVNGVEVGGRPLGIIGGPSKRSAAGALRIDALEIPDAQITFESPIGRIPASISTDLVLSEKGIYSTVFSGQFSAPISGTTYRAHIEAPELALEPLAAGQTRLRLSQATVTPIDVPWIAEAVDGEIDWQPEHASGRLSVGRLVNRQDPILVAPLAVRANATLSGPIIDFILDLIVENKPTSKLEVKGRHDRSSNNGSATISMQPLGFKPGGLQPGDIFPALGSRFENVQGTLAIDGSLRWGRPGLSPDLLVRLKDLSFATSIATLRALSSTIRVVRLWPPATAPSQTLSATIETAGLPPAKLRLDGELTSAPALKIERAEIGFAAGKLTATPFIIGPGDLHLETTLGVEDVDLAEIIKLMSIEGLSGTGQLDGHIPLSLQSGKIAIESGRLTARGPGVLRYKPDRVPDQIAAAGESVALAMKALSDFHYDSLTLELHKAGSGEGTVLLHLQGSNPAVLQNQPFDFNIRIDSNFDRLVDFALLSLTSAKELLRKASGREQP